MLPLLTAATVLGTVAATPLCQLCLRAGAAGSARRAGAATRPGPGAVVDSAARF
ncbi:hypothetical protein [Roseomonas sp. BN140053]|uniref:hypothetical protein n=1 Tax=Roseomonas sp. BN140053 TaxID=3391898 RepID=UPI0039EBD5C3